MIEYKLIVAWLGMGAIGIWLHVRDWQRTFVGYNSGDIKVTPTLIFCWIISCFMGGFVLLLGLIYEGIHLYKQIDKSCFKGWFSKPLFVIKNKFEVKDDD